ncbi:hypothetical protein [Paraclostridium sordellii]|uniref:hypothetical protein n=1 Tax=Paraclostridium sordellii TaxID=1505 RepID=UPI00189A2139|nr:hypothetical protein [Paeniclostridium sordellii]
MSLSKFMYALDDKEEIKVTKKDYKNKVDNELKTKFEETDNNDNEFNLLDMDNIKKTEKKAPMTIYFKEEDLKLLKAISKVKGITVNKMVMSILERPLKTTKNNLPDGFDIDKLAREYDKNSKNTKSGKK